MSNPRATSLRSHSLARITVLLFVSIAASVDAHGSPPTLELAEAVQSSLKANFSLRVAAMDPEIAASGVEEASSVFDTELFASGNLEETSRQTTFSATQGTSRDNRSWTIGARRRFSSGAQVTARGNYSRDASNAGVNTSNLSQAADASLSLRQPLLRGRGSDVNRAGVARARAGVEAAGQSFREAVLNVLARTEEAYWETARRQAGLELKQSSLQVAETLLEEARERRNVGRATRIEVLQAEAARAERREEIITARQRLEEAADQLLLSMGRLLPDMAPIEELPFEVRPLPGEIRGVRPFPDLWRDVLADDPSLGRQEAILEQRRLDRTVARNELRPELDLVATGGYLGLDNEDAQTAFDNLTEGQGYAWSVGFEFSMPWGRRGEKAALRSADKELEQESLRLLELKQELFRELRSAWRSYNARTESREAAELTVSLQEAAFAQEQEKYAEGLSVFRDVLEAQQDLDLARERLLDTRFQQIRTRIRIDELSGRLLDLYNIPEDLFR